MSGADHTPRGPAPSGSQQKRREQQKERLLTWLGSGEPTFGRVGSSWAEPWVLRLSGQCQGAGSLRDAAGDLATVFLKTLGSVVRTTASRR